MSHYDYPDILDIDIEEDELLNHSFDPEQLDKEYEPNRSEICSVDIEDDRESEMKSDDCDLPPVQDQWVRNSVVPKLDLTKAVNSHSEEIDLEQSHDKSESSQEVAPFDSVPT